LSIFPRSETHVKASPDVLANLTEEATVSFRFRAMLFDREEDEVQVMTLTTSPYILQATVRMIGFQDVCLDRVNQLLRNTKSTNIPRFQVPEELINFDSEQISFIANQHFRFLSIPEFNNGEISSKLLDGLALNTGLEHLRVDFPDHGLADFWKNLEHLFQNVLPSCSLRHVALNLRDEDYHHNQPRDTFFEEVTQ
jgi:hypothetical protein